MANYEPINFDLETVDITTTTNKDYPTFLRVLLYRLYNLHLLKIFQL